MMRFSLWVSCAVLLVSCRNQGTNLVLASLDRSERIDLFCADGTQLSGNAFDFDEVLPLELCDSDVTFEPDVTPQFLGAVTQTESGTLAVVNFTGNAIPDTNVTVPGVTAVRVGEQPTAVQVSPVDSRYTYVSSFSPKSVQAISTREVITGSPVPPQLFDDEGRPIPPVEPTLESQELRFDAGPTDLVLYELATFDTTVDDGEIVDVTTDVAYRFLFVAIPELGQVVQIQTLIDDETGEQTFGTITPLQLPTLDCDAVTAEAPPVPVSDENDYNRICPADFDNREEGRFIKTVDTTSECTDGDGTGPMPVALAVDQGNPNDLTDDALLVADANQPVIHRFELFVNGAAPLEPIVSLAPTVDVVVTPPVPASSDQDDRAATLSYAYAITAVDGSILAIDYTEESETFGGVFPVLAGVSPRANEENVESRNRVFSSFSNARAIEVLSPFYELETDPDTGGLRIPEGDSETDICNPADDDAFALAQNPSNFRGVFLAVSLSNGTMFYLDVYDLNAPCRGGQGNVACTLAETGADRFASIRRHRRRFGFTPSTFIDIDGTPSLQFNAAPGALDESDGQASNSDGPGLEAIQCPESMIDVFGEPDPMVPNSEGLICASSQVWSSFTQRWDARWQGAIPNSQGGLGLFSDESFEGEPGNWFLGGDVPFCRIGVLGEQDGTPSGTEFSWEQLPSYGGDRLVIIGELPPSTRNEPACEDFVDLLEDIDDRQVWFPIIRAFDEQLEIGPEPPNARYTLDQVRFCFNQFTEYQIQTVGVYTVTGTTSGFIHRVVPDEDTDECVFDETRPIVFDPETLEDVDTLLTGRAFPGTQYINPLVSFEIEPFEDITVTDSTVALLNFNILNQFGVEVLDTGGGRRSLPGSMLFSPERDQLFFVDFNAGVRRIVFSPLSIVQTFQ